MFNFLKTPKGLIITGIILLVIVLLISYNWETIKGWFSSATPASGRYAAPGSTAKKMCVSLGSGDCSYLGLHVPCIECTKRGISIN